MPYIEKTGVKTVKEQLQQWYHVMADPRIDGFNNFTKPNQSTNICTGKQTC